MNLTYKVAALLFKEWLLGSIASQVTAPATRLWQGFSSKVTLVLGQHFAAAWLTFEVVSVDPVEDVESAVDSQSEEIVRGDGLGFASLLDHEELRQDGHRLQVDGEGPEDLHQGELVVEQQR